eukprot:3280579-Rhodomonas_salina.2
MRRDDGDDKEGEGVWWANVAWHADIIEILGQPFLKQRLPASSLPTGPTYSQLFLTPRLSDARGPRTERGAGRARAARLWGNERQ